MVSVKPKSVTLGDAEEIAYQYCKPGELSRFIRMCIRYYDKEQKKPLTPVEKKENILHTVVFFILGVGFFVIACSTMFDILTTVTATLLILCSLVLFIYTYLSIKRYKKTDEVK